MPQWLTTVTMADTGLSHHHHPHASHHSVFVSLSFVIGALLLSRWSSSFLLWWSSSSVHVAYVVSFLSLLHVMFLHVLCAFVHYKPLTSFALDRSHCRADFLTRGFVRKTNPRVCFPGFSKTNPHCFVFSIHRVHTHCAHKQAQNHRKC